MALTEQLVVRTNPEQAALLNHIVDVLDVKKSTLIRASLVSASVQFLVFRARQQTDDASPAAVVDALLADLPTPLNSPVRDLLLNEDNRGPLLEDANIEDLVHDLVSDDQMAAMAYAMFARPDDGEELEDEDVLFDSAEAVLVALLRRDPREYAAALTNLFNHSDEKLAQLLKALEEGLEDED